MASRKPATVIDKSDSEWHWDRKIPVALIITIILVFAGQIGTASWWASKTDARIERLEQQATTAAPLAATQGDRLTRVEEKLVGVQTGITEIKAMLQPRIMPR